MTTHEALLKYEHTLNLPEGVSANEEASEALYAWLPEPQYMTLASLIAYGPLSLPELQAVLTADAYKRGVAWIDEERMFPVMVGLLAKGLVKRELLTPVPSVVKGYMA